MPEYASRGAAGADLRACIRESVTVLPGATAVIPTGLAAEIPRGYAGLVYARSGMATRRGLAPANKVGVIDSDYRGELMVPVHNHGPTPAEIRPGERVAQLIITPVAAARFVEARNLDPTPRGAGGFGSTGD